MNQTSSDTSERKLNVGDDMVKNGIRGLLYRATSNQREKIPTHLSSVIWEFLPVALTAKDPM